MVVLLVVEVSCSRIVLVMVVMMIYSIYILEKKHPNHEIYLQMRIIFLRLFFLLLFRFFFVCLFVFFESFGFSDLPTIAYSFHNFFMHFLYNNRKSIDWVVFYISFFHSLHMIKFAAINQGKQKVTNFSACLTSISHIKTCGLNILQYCCCCWFA